MKKQFVTITLLLAAVGLFAKTTTIYHTSDTHGFYYPKDGHGGFAAVANVVKNGPQPYLLLDSGDFANGTAEAKKSKGIKSVQLMNQVGYHASTVGNHEFDFYDAGVEPMLKAMHFPMLAANFVEAQTGQLPPNVKPYEIFTVDGVKVAVIGLANTHPTRATKKYRFIKPLKALKNILPEVEALHPNVVVVIVHDSLNDEKHGMKPYVRKIAQKFGGRVHLVFGGHAHKIIQNEKIKDTLFTESGCYIKNISKVTVETDDKTGQFISATSELIPLDIAQVGEDAQVAAYAKSLMEPGLGEVIGYATEKLALVPQNPQHKDGPLNVFIADLGREYAAVQIFAHNNGGSRVDMEKGPVTRHDIVDINPFENKVVRLTVDGKFLKFLVEHTLLPRSLYTYSGMTITYRNHKGKVKDLQLFVDGKLVQDNDTFTFATNDYIMTGNMEGWPFLRLKDVPREQVGDKGMNTLLEEGVKRYSPLKAPATGRIVEYK